jgi:hypothetical protein
MFCDKWGNGYSTDIRGELVRCDYKKKKLIHTGDALPRASEVEYYLAASGFHAVQEMPDGSVYGITHWGIAFHYVPVKEGHGKMTDLGPIYGKDGKNLVLAGAPNLVVQGGKMYYGVGGHGKAIDTVKKDVFLFKKDIKTRKVTLIHRLHPKKVVELTSSAIIDSKGMIYFGAHAASISPEDKEAVDFLSQKGKGGEPPKRNAWLLKMDAKLIAKKYKKKYKKLNKIISRKRFVEGDNSIN